MRLRHLIRLLNAHGHGFLSTNRSPSTTPPQHLPRVCLVLLHGGLSFLSTVLEWARVGFCIARVSATCLPGHVRAPTLSLLRSVLVVWNLIISSPARACPVTPAHCDSALKHICACAKQSLIQYISIHTQFPYFSSSRSDTLPPRHRLGRAGLRTRAPLAPCASRLPASGRAQVPATVVAGLMVTMCPAHYIAWTAGSRKVRVKEKDLCCESCGC